MEPGVLIGSSRLRSNNNDWDLAMKITALEPQKKRKSRLNLYVDGNFKSGIDVGTATSLGLFEGKEIEESDLSSLADEESYQLCLDKAFLLLGIRMQTEHELWEKLGKKSLRRDIGRVVARLKELGYVDDCRFAALWVNSRAHSRGPNLLRTELIKKGVKKEVIDAELSHLEREAQIEAATAVISSKDKPELTKEERFKKLGGLLARRGFSYDIIKKALEQENAQ